MNGLVILVLFLKMLSWYYVKIINVVIFLFQDKVLLMNIEYSIHGQVYIIVYFATQGTSS